MGSVSGIDHVAVTVADLEASCAFSSACAGTATSPTGCRQVEPPIRIVAQIDAGAEILPAGPADARHEIQPARQARQGKPLSFEDMGSRPGDKVSWPAAGEAPAPPSQIVVQEAP